MSDENINDFLCPACGSSEIYPFVQHGSYFTTCIQCGESGPATSYIAVAHTMADSHFKAILVDDNFREVETLAEGKGSEIESVILKVAAEGKLIMLQSI